MLSSKSLGAASRRAPTQYQLDLAHVEEFNRHTYHTDGIALIEANIQTSNASKSVAQSCQGILLSCLRFLVTPQNHLLHVHAMGWVRLSTLCPTRRCDGVSGSSMSSVDT